MSLPVSVMVIKQKRAVNSLRVPRVMQHTCVKYLACLVGQGGAGSSGSNLNQPSCKAGEGSLAFQQLCKSQHWHPLQI